MATFLLVALAVATNLPAQAGTTLEREFVYPVDRLTMTSRGEAAVVRFRGGLREYVPGRPDLPIVSERIELPEGTRVEAVEQIGLDARPIPGSTWVGPVGKPTTGLGAPEGAAPDPVAYGRSSFGPDPAVVLGYQGTERGRNVAYLLVHPVQWNPSSRRLQRIERLRVRLSLGVHRDPGMVRRERIVREWEGAAASSPPALVTSAPLASVNLSGPGPHPFKATQLPSTLGSPVAYVIITGDALAGEFQHLADWKTQAGLPAVVRTLSFIRQEYPFGVDDADKVRQFIRDAYARWGTKWVLLGGDTDVIPTRLVYSSFYPTSSGERGDIACDMYYSCLDGSWNNDGDAVFGEGDPQVPNDQVDLLPEVWVGRAPVSTVAQAQQFIDKTFQYTRTPLGNYETHTLFFAEVLFPEDWQPGMTATFDGAQIAEDCLTYLRANPSLKYARLYENYLDPRWEPGAIQELKARVIDSLNVGYNLSVHIGHGYRNVMSCADGTLDNANAASLVNGNRLTNLYATNCTSNAIDFPSIGEAFIHAAGGGAVTNIGSTRVDFPNVSQYFQSEYFRLVFQDSVSAVGEAQARQKLPFVGPSSSENAYRWTEMALLLLGDPELHIWTGTPRTLTVTHPSSLAANATSLSVNVKIGGQPLFGARVTAYKPNDEYRVATTDGAGNAVLDFRPDSTGSFFLTVTAYDSRPYQAVVPITAASPALLAERTPVIDDDSAGGTIGNGNQVLDAGEVVDLRIPVRNNGGGPATSVTGTLSTSDPMVTMLAATNTYGTMSPNTVANGNGWFRISTPYTLGDQREIPFTLTLQDLEAQTFVETIRLTLRAPELRHFGHVVVETVGDGDGHPEPGETVSYSVKLVNLGTGTASGVTAILRNYDGLATVSDSTATFGTVAAGAEVSADAFQFSVSPSGSAAAFELRVSSSFGLSYTQRLDLAYPSSPGGLSGLGSRDAIALQWGASPESDLVGYNVYRSGPGGGTLAKVNRVPTGRSSYFLDSGLAPLTRYDYAVAAVDSSGNESARTTTISVSTNPPYHTIFPIEMGRNTPSPVTVAPIYQAGHMDIVAGADVLYCWHADGTSPVDADGLGVTSGDFTTLGSYYAAGASVADLDGGGLEIIAPAWDSQAVYVFDTQGQVKPGWPFATGAGIWSSVAVGNLGGDSRKELVFGSNGTNLFALRSDGSEWIDGDANSSTTGVFKNLGTAYNYATPALADLDGDGWPEIVYGAFDGVLHAWHADGTNLPGFPVTIGGIITASVAIGYLDGSTDTQPEIVVPSGAGKDSLYVFKRDGGGRAGFPVYYRSAGSNRQPSPALADIDRDGFLDIVVAGTDGKLYVYNRNGVLDPNFTNVRFSSMTDAASECSPVVADVSGDGIPDIVIGDENGVLSAFSGTGALLPGFPITLGAEVRGAPALCDCDGDGLSEIVVAGWDTRLYVWDYDFPFSPAGTPEWPQFHHDAMRTGFTWATRTVDTTEEAPSVMQLQAPAPNPARSLMNLGYAVPAEGGGKLLEIAVFDLVGRKVRVLAQGPAVPGRFSARWDLRSSDGSPVRSGVYFVRMSLAGFRQARRFVVLR
jgi:hypothetical protein